MQKRNMLNPLNWLRAFGDWIDSKNQILQIIIMLTIVFLIRTFGFGLYWVPTGSMEPTMLVGESFFSDKFTILFTPIKRGDIISMNAPTFQFSDNPFIKLFQMYLWGPDNWTKRVIGIPGDHIKGTIEGGEPKIYLNGKLIDEPYVNPYPIIYVKEISHQLSFKFPFFEKKERYAFKTFDPSIDLFSKDQPFYRLTPEILIPNESNPLILYSKTPSIMSSVTDVFDIYLEKDEYWGMGDNRLGSFDSRGFGKIKKELIHGRIKFRLFSFDSASSLIYDMLGLGHRWFFAPLFDLFLNKARSWDRWFSVVK
jgi:signal peptidase I